MRRFVWRLQRVLDIKTIEEQRKRTELFELTEKLAEARGQLLMRKRILENIINGLAGENPNKRLGKQEFFLRFSATNDEQIKRLQERVNELKSAQKEKFVEVLKVRRFKESLERLRAEAKEEFIKEQEKLEQKELDDGATISFARKVMKWIGVDNPED